LFDQIYQDAAPYYQKLDEYATKFGGAENSNPK
jgi:hypothetical protein